MKKYLIMVLLLTGLFIPMHIKAVSFVQIPGDNNVNDLDRNNTNDDDFNDNDTNNNDIPGNNNNTNTNTNTGTNNNGITNDNDDILDDDNSDFMNYVFVGLGGIALGAFVTYFIVKKD